MKKACLFFAISLFIIILFASSSFATVEPVETPDVKIIIDGEITVYKDIPLSINQRTFLPLREILKNLGVPDDDEHIVWNRSDASVTIYKDSTKIFLQIGSKTAYVNDATIMLDVAPIGYTNQRIYIPARFVSQILGKKVVWDGSSNSVYIRGADEYYQAEEILRKSEAAMNFVSKAVIDANMQLQISKTGVEKRYDIDMQTNIDKIGKLMYMTTKVPFLKKVLDFEIYYANSMEYSKDPFSSKWTVNEITDQAFKKMLDDNLNLSVINDNDVLCAGLIRVDDNLTNEILLKGCIFPKNIFSRIKAGFGIKSLKLRKYDIEISLDRNTYRINRLAAVVEGGYASTEGNYSLTSKVESVYKDFNGSFDIIVPPELKEIK